MSAKKALECFYIRQMRQSARKGRKNARPEADLKVEVLAWLNANGFNCHSIESKAVYSQRAGRYIRGQTAPGVSDIFGCAPNGVGVFIELKAPGRRSTLKEHQREFLLAKIDCGAFAVCVDSVAALEALWQQFRAKTDKSLLKEALPKGRYFNGEITAQGGDDE